MEVPLLKLIGVSFPPITHAKVSIKTHGFAEFKFEVIYVITIATF